MNASPIKKFVAFFSLIASLTATPLALSAETPAPEPDASVPLSDLAVSEGIGTVQERFTGRSPRTVIQIQDVHAHVTAQQNIATILERLRTVFGVEKIALEGAWVSTSLPKSHALPTSREKQLLAGTLLNDDRISGPVYAAIMSPELVTLVGIEEEALYEKNRALFLAHLEKTQEIIEKLRVYGDSLKESQKAVWGPELLAFGKAFEKFCENSDLGKFLPLLLKTSDGLGNVSSNLTQVLLLRDIMTLEKSFAKERLEAEVLQVIKKYRDMPWTLEELIRGGKIPSEEIGFYPEIKKMTRLYQLRDEVLLRDLTAQIRTLTGRLLEKIIRTSDERALWEKTERFFLSKKILLLQATPEDVKFYESEKLLIETELAKVGLAESLALSFSFYESVKKRDEIFFQRIMTDPALAGDIAVVTGGFHTDGLSQKFRDAGISYITITPELGGTAMNEKLYNSRMKESGWQLAKNFPLTTPAASHTLSELRNAIAWIDEQFEKSYLVLLQTRDVRQAEKVFCGEKVPLSRAAEISHLSREGRIVPEPKTGTEVNASELRISDFIAKPRPEQLKTVRGWFEQVAERREKAMLVSSVGILARMLSEEKAVKLLGEAVDNGDIVALAQDVPATEMPEILLSTRGIDRFEATDIGMLLDKTPRFQRLAKKRPFAIMENERLGGAYVVLPEKPLSLVLFRIITLNPSLYRAAKDPAFLALLGDLVAEILSRDLQTKAA